MRILALWLLLGGCTAPIERPIAALVVNGVSAMEDRLNRGRTAGGHTMAWNTTGVEIATAVSASFGTIGGTFPAADLNDGSVAPDADWGFNLCPVRVTNLSESSQWAPTYGDRQRPDRIGYLVFGR